MSRAIAFLSLCGVTAFVPAASVATTVRLTSGRSASLACKEQATKLDQYSVTLDPEMVKAVWKAAQASTVHEVRGLRIDAAAAQIEAEQRVDAALRELAREQQQGTAAQVFSEPLEQQQIDLVPTWLTVAPPAIMGLSVVLFVLNTFGVFGAGPDLSALVK